MAHARSRRRPQARRRRQGHGRRDRVRRQGLSEVVRLQSSNVRKLYLCGQIRDMNAAEGRRRCASARRRANALR